jgi:hypothetical protein
VRWSRREGGSGRGREKVVVASHGAQSECALELPGTRALRRHRSLDATRSCQDETRPPPLPRPRPVPTCAADDLFPADTNHGVSFTEPGDQRAAAVDDARSQSLDARPHSASARGRPRTPRSLTISLFSAAALDSSPKRFVMPQQGRNPRIATPLQSGQEPQILGVSELTWLATQGHGATPHDAQRAQHDGVAWPAMCEWSAEAQAAPENGCRTSVPAFYQEEPTPLLPTPAPPTDQVIA